DVRIFRQQVVDVLFNALIPPLPSARTFSPVYAAPGKFIGVEIKAPAVRGFLYLRPLTGGEPIIVFAVAGIAFKIPAPVPLVYAAIAASVISVAFVVLLLAGIVVVVLIFVISLHILPASYFAQSPIGFKIAQAWIV